MSAEVVCRHCQVEVSRKTARAEKWLRSPDGWTCPNHPPLAPIDFSFAAMLCADAGIELESAMTRLFHRDASALENLDEVEALLVEIREATAALRAARAA